MDFEIISKNWEKLAKTNPLWAICTSDHKKDGSWDQAEFYQTGTVEIATVFELLRQRHIEVADRACALDFGCGVGRLSRALSGHFAHVTGVDVAATMVAMARSNNAALADKLAFVHNTRSDLSLFATGHYSFVYSSLVLQHISYPESMDYVREFVRVLRPGGLAVFQAITQDVRKLSPIRRLRDKVSIRNRLARIGIGNGFAMRMNVVPEAEIRQILQSAGAEIVDVATTNQACMAQDNRVQYIDEADCVAWVSKQFAVRKPKP
ncbi:MAG: class I SAM-dependent methyltransferase [Myxococcales bacterium]|nr:class I SAM-dependent methyltransferase [Myxococcales bacterium]